MHATNDAPDSWEAWLERLGPALVLLARQYKAAGSMYLIIGTHVVESGNDEKP